MDEIARALAPQCYYSLKFRAVAPSKKLVPSKLKEVNVSFDIDSGTWDMKPMERAKRARTIFANRPVTIKEGNYCASFTIVYPDKDE